MYQSEDKDESLSKKLKSLNYSIKELINFLNQTSVTLGEIYSFFSAIRA